MKNFIFCAFLKGYLLMESLRKYENFIELTASNINLWFYMVHRHFLPPKITEARGERGLKSLPK